MHILTSKQVWRLKSQSSIAVRWTQINAIGRESSVLFHFPSSLGREEGKKYFLFLLSLSLSLQPADGRRLVSACSSIRLMPEAAFTVNTSILPAFIFTAVVAKDRCLTVSKLYVLSILSSPVGGLFL